MKKLKISEKKYFYMLVLSIFIGVTALVGSSYALIQRVITGNNTYSMRTGNFLVEFKDNNTISLSNQVPTYDNVGINSNDKFTFSVTNTGNYISNYAVKIVETSTDTLGEVIRYAVDYGDGFSYENVHSLENNQYIIQNKSLAVGATDTYNVVFWLDIDASEIYIEKDFSAKVVIESTQDEYKYGTNILQAVYNQVDKEGLVAINNSGGTLAGETDEIREYRYSGANPNNYVWFNCVNGYTSGSEHCEKWRIIGSFYNTYENGVGTYRMLKIVKDEALSTTYLYNSNAGNDANFEGSSLETYLNGTYFNSLSTNTQDLIIKAKWNNGELFSSNTSITSLDYEKDRNVYNYIGLINASDFGYATDNSLWETLLNTASTFTSSNNYLYQENSMILNTPNVLGTGIYYMSSNALTKGNTTTSYKVKPTVYLKPDVSIIAGFGTSDEPYELAIKHPMVYGEKSESKVETELYKILEVSLANNLLEDDGDARIVSGKKDDENLKNYVWYSGKLWRIVALNNDGSIKLVTDENITTMNWGSSTAFEGSYVYQWLNEDFLDTLYNYENLLVTDYKWNATINENNTKPSTNTMVTCMVGGLNSYEYVQSYYKSTALEGYLNNEYYWWVINPVDNSSLLQVIYYSSGLLSATNTLKGMAGIRPSIVLNVSVEIFGGNGTKDNPYQLVGDIGAPNINEKLNNRISGEYINFNNDLYRIVNTEDGLTKIIKVDYLRNNDDDIIAKFFATSSIYGSNTNSQTDDYFDYYLNNTWYNNIKEKFRNMIVPGVWYLGALNYTNYEGYKSTICEDSDTTETIKNCQKTSLVYNGLVGIGRYGEIFSTQLTKGGHLLSHDMVTITPYNDNRVMGIYNNSGSVTFSIYALYSVRPSMYLSDNVYITVGIGTYNDPFELAL